MGLCGISQFFVLRFRNASKYVYKVRMFLKGHGPTGSYSFEYKVNYICAHTIHSGLKKD